MKTTQQEGDIIIVKPASSTVSENYPISIENLVRKTVIQTCLIWLKKNNKHDCDINVTMCTSKITHPTLKLVDSCEEASLTQISFTPTNYVPRKETL